MVATVFDGRDCFCVCGLLDGSGELFPRIVLWNCSMGLFLIYREKCMGIGVEGGLGMIWVD